MGAFFCERGARDPCEKSPVARKIVKKGKNVVSVDINFELGYRLFSKRSRHVNGEPCRDVLHIILYFVFHQKFVSLSESGCRQSFAERSKRK